MAVSVVCASLVLAGRPVRPSIRHCNCQYGAIKKLTGMCIWMGWLPYISFVVPVLGVVCVYPIPRPEGVYVHDEVPFS